MSQVYPYVIFDGNCREAMAFYQSCLGGELDLLPVEGSQMAADMPPDMHNRIMHSMLRSGDFAMMAADTMGSDAVVRGNDVHLCLVCTSKDEIETNFARLAEGGKVGHPLNEEFFGIFGDLTDRFGVRWMLQYSPNPQG